MERLLEFAGNHPILMLAAGMMTMLLAFYEVRARGRGSFDVSPADAVRLINAGALVIDVRSADEYAGGHITDARNVPAAEVSAAADSLGKYRDKPVLVCDANGPAAARAAAALRKNGFTRVFSLRGGIAAWAGEHLPLGKTGKGKR